MPQPTVIVMLKTPRLGRVKTRLANDIGPVAATWWFRHQTRRVLRRIDDPRWRLVLAISPDVDCWRSRAWPDRKARIPQGRGDLGQRMARVMQHVGGPCVVIGGDIPGIERHHLARAFAALGRVPAVLGPATDGGYWLVGLRHPEKARRAFEHVRWSTTHALNDTLPTLPQPVLLVDELADVDTADDLRFLRDGKVGP